MDENSAIVELKAELQRYRCIPCNVRLHCRAKFICYTLFALPLGRHNGREFMDGQWGTLILQRIDDKRHLR